jgi:hypothetical protein
LTNAYIPVKSIFKPTALFLVPPIPAMRIRLRSSPPLPPLKAWFVIPSTFSMDSNTITDLKREIHSRFLTSNETLHTSQITLELDEFELLDDSSLNVIRENDLLV